MDHSFNNFVLRPTNKVLPQGQQNKLRNEE